MSLQERVPEYILEDSPKMCQHLRMGGISVQDLQVLKVDFQELYKVSTLVIGILESIRDSQAALLLALESH